MRILLFAAALIHGSLAFGQVREVTDSTGRTVAIPQAPQRIVALHEPLIAVPLLELGMHVVGAYGRSDDGGSLMAVDFIASVLGPEAAARRIPGIGAVGNIDLERLRALKPDLIVGTELDVRNAPLMSPIAPVYLQNSGAGAAYGVDAEEALARLMNRQEVFAARKAAYLERVGRLRARLPDAAAPRRYLAVFVHDRINVVGEMSGLVQALEDLGYQRLPLEQAPRRNRQSTLMEPVSAEVFARLDPDLLVVMNSFAGGRRDEAAIRAELDRMVPGWSRFMKPAREGRVIFVDSAQVTTPSIASAQHMLDAFEAWADRRQP